MGSHYLDNDVTCCDWPVVYDGRIFMIVNVLTEFSGVWTIPMAFSGELDSRIFVDSSSITFIVFITVLSFLLYSLYRFYNF